MQTDYTSVPAFHLHKEVHHTQATYMQQFPSINELVGHKSVKGIAIAWRGGAWTSNTKTKLLLETQQPQHERHHSSLPSTKVHNVWFSFTPHVLLCGA